MPVHQDLTIFSIDDDEVPLAGYGAVDGNGDIVTPTFSTDPTHARPYLKRVLDFGESMVDFLAGGSLIGQLSVEIVDAPTDEADQDSGIMTFLLAAASGDTALLGVRMVFREGGEVVFDGVCGPITMPRLSTFHLQMRDARERERGLKLFTLATSTCIFPRVGPKEGWGHQTEYDQYDGYVNVGEPVMPRIKGVLAQWRDLLALPGPGIGVSGGFLMEHDLAGDDPYRELLLKYGGGVQTFVADSTFLDLGLYRFDDVIIEWSATGEPGTYVSIGPFVSGGLFVIPNVFRIEPHRVNGVDGWFVRAIYAVLSEADHYAGLKPDDEQFVYVRVVSNREPNDEVPLYIEERFGRLLKKCYDGDYTKSETMVPVRYDIARMDEMIASTPIARARITAPVDDGRTWLQQNVYRPASHAPSIRNGMVYPLKYELPDENEPLTQLDDTNTIHADWAHGPDNVVNQVIVEYEREVVPTNLPQFAKPRTTKVIIERNNLSDSSQRRHGTQPQVIKPVTLRGVVSESNAFSRTPTDETGGLVSARIGHELLRRYTNGAQVVVAECHRTAAVDALQEGDWVIGGWSWLPDYVTRRRGMSRLLQVMKVRRAQPHTRGFLLVDAGPHDVPLSQPTLGNLVENADGSVSIDVSNIPANARAEVQFALGPAEPDVSSGEWKLVGYSVDDADVTMRTIAHLWPGRTVWVRGRGTKYGRRASAWTNPVSINLDTLAMLRDFTLDFVRDPDSPDYGKPLIRWDAIAGTNGVRVMYHVHAPHSDQPLLGELLDFQDFDASEGEGIVDELLRQWEQITVQVIGYPGFVPSPYPTGGVVSGDAGVFSALKTIARVETHYVKPSVGEIASRDGFDGLLELEIIDQQLTITSIWFRTREGSDAADWSPFVESLAPPHDSTVRIIPGASSAIGYEVYAYDHTGIERLFKSGTVEYPYEGSPSLRMQITEVSGADPDERRYYEVRVIDPAPQGTDSITLFAEEDGATIIDPTDLTTVGVPTGVVTDNFATTGVVDVEIERPQYVGGSPAPDGEVHFRAEASARGDAIETITVPAEEEPAESVTFDDNDLAIERDDPGNNILNFIYTILTGSCDHVHIWVERVGIDLDFVDTGAYSPADGVAEMDVESEWNWNMIGVAETELNAKTLRFYVVAHDADHNPIGQSGVSGDFTVYAEDI